MSLRVHWDQVSRFLVFFAIVDSFWASWRVPAIVAAPVVTDEETGKQSTRRSGHHYPVIRFLPKPRVTLWENGTDLTFCRNPS